MRTSPFLLLFLVVSIPLLLIGVISTLGSSALVAWRPPLIWSERYGVNGPFDNYVSDLREDNSAMFAVGDLGVSGGFRNSSSFLARYDLGGNRIWQDNRTTGELSSVTLTDSNVYTAGVPVTSKYPENISINKFDLNGILIWNRQFASGSVLTPALSYSNGGVYVAGSSNPLTNQRFTGQVLFVREYDPTGNIVWTSEFSNSSSEEVYGIYTDSSGAYVLTSTSLVKYALSGSELWSVNVSQLRGQVSGDGTNVYVLSALPFPRLSTGSGVLMKFGPYGNLEWNVELSIPDGSGVDQLGLFSDSSGSYVAVDSDFSNLYLMKYDHQGKILWSSQAPSALGSIISDHYPFTLDVGPSLLVLSGAAQGTTTSAYTLALLEVFSKDASLIFFGLNPPWSFVVLVAIAGAAASGAVLYIRHRRRVGSLGLESPDSRLPAHVPTDAASIK